MRISKSEVFLFEVMFVILIFALSAAICASVFAKAHSFSIRSEDLTMAVVRAESAAEIFKAGMGGADQQALEHDGSFTEYYNGKWQRIWGDDVKERAEYVVVMTMMPDNDLPVQACEMDVRRFSKDEEGQSLIKLHACRYAEGG